MVSLVGLSVGARKAFMRFPLVPLCCHLVMAPMADVSSDLV